MLKICINLRYNPCTCCFNAESYDHTTYQHTYTTNHTRYDWLLIIIRTHKPSLHHTSTVSVCVWHTSAIITIHHSIWLTQSSNTTCYTVDQAANVATSTCHLYITWKIILTFQCSRKLAQIIVQRNTQEGENSIVFAYRNVTVVTRWRHITYKTRTFGVAKYEAIYSLLFLQ